MFKKTIISMLIMLIILFAPIMGHVANANGTGPTIDFDKYQVFAPEEDALATTKKSVLISGKAPAGIEIIIDLYTAIDLTGNNYSLNRLPEEDNYILVSSNTIKSGALGFGEEIELILGINKLIITFNVKDGPIIERVIYYYEKEHLKKTSEMAL